MNTPTLEVTLDSQPIELCKLLKVVDLVSGGGEAKLLISEGYVSVNGQIETQKRKKIYNNDLVSFNGETILVICDIPVSEVVKAKPLKSAEPQSSKKDAPTRHQRKNKKPSTPPANSGKRRPIKF